MSAKHKKQNWQADFKFTGIEKYGQGHLCKAVQLQRDIFTWGHFRETPKKIIFYVNRPDIKKTVLNKFVKDGTALLVKWIRDGDIERSDRNRISGLKKWVGDFSNPWELVL